nr:ubiquitin carboxyl-terminal hydrolase 21-like [Ipomoea batatas]
MSVDCPPSLLATLPSFAATTANLHPFQFPAKLLSTVRCDAKNLTNNSSTKQESVPENNVLLKAAWYGSKLLGIVDSLLRSPTTTETKAPEGIAELSSDGWSGVVDGSIKVWSIVIGSRTLSNTQRNPLPTPIPTPYIHTTTTFLFKKFFKQPFATSSPPLPKSTVKMEVTGGGGFPSLPPSFSSMVVADRRSHQQQHVLIRSEPDWTDLWSAGNDSNLDLPFSAYGISGFDRKSLSLARVSKWEALPTFSSWSDVKEQVEMGLETKPFIPSEVERKEEEEEPVVVEDNIFNLLVLFSGMIILCWWYSVLYAILVLVAYLLG